MQETKALIRIQEGYSKKAYKCSEGYLTIGVGHQVKPSDNIELDKEYPDEFLEQLFDEDFRTAANGAFDLLEDYPLIKREAKAIVTCMVFQLGLTGVSKFKNMLAALAEYNYGDAADAMLNSRWNKQTPKRCQELADWMRSL
tara:strand:- start:246 stop:671 length:426 start_codon:yes stop_codon:yes gene_type:complete